LHSSGIRVLHRVFVPFATAISIPALETDPFRAPVKLYQALATAGDELRWRDITTAVMPSPDDAATLNIPDGVPLFLHTRSLLDGTGQTLALEETRLPADRSTITHSGSS
jgi:GntR family transcriptional regulator